MNSTKYGSYSPLKPSKMKNYKFYQFATFMLGICVVLLLLLILRERRQHMFHLTEVEQFVRTLDYNLEDPYEARYSRRLLGNDENIIFVGGIPRSGTTLMRAMLDAHPTIRCGEETMIIPNLLGLRQSWQGDFFRNSSLSQSDIDDAVSAFVIEMISKNGEMAPRLCNKDPFTALHLPLLHKIFPRARFILMIRDPRAVVHSMVDRVVPVMGFNRSDPEQMLKAWNSHFTTMYSQCNNLPRACLKVYYERLVQLPSTEAHRILEFLQEDWSDDVIRHQELIGSEIKLNPEEFSTSQVKNAVNTKALTSWKGFFSKETMHRMKELVPMMTELGYDVSNLELDYSNFARNDFYEKQKS